VKVCSARLQPERVDYVKRQRESIPNIAIKQIASLSFGQPVSLCVQYRNSKQSQLQNVTSLTFTESGVIKVIQKQQQNSNCANDSPVSLGMIALNCD